MSNGIKISEIIDQFIYPIHEKIELRNLGVSQSVLLFACSLVFCFALILVLFSFFTLCNKGCITVSPVLVHRCWRAPQSSY